jgi:hypothetical protein
LQAGILIIVAFGLEYTISGGDGGVVSARLGERAGEQFKIRVE